MELLVSVIALIVVVIVLARNQKREDEFISYQNDQLRRNIERKNKK